jgi:hypothetical protein
MNSTLKLVMQLFAVAILAAVVSALLGCATPPQYHNPDKTEQEWNADRAECMNKSWGTNGFFQWQTYDFCMKGKGWARAD